MKKNFVEFINATAKVASANLIASKALRMKKGCPFNSIVKETQFIGFGIGYDYVTNVNGALSRSGATNEYEAASVWHKVYNRWFNSHKADDKKLYLRCMASHPQMAHFAKCHNVWYADGKEVAYEVVEQWLYASDKPKASSAARQVSQGVDTERVIRYQLVSVENIVYFKQGDNIWTKD